eukprot:scaffold652222_cov48-Prasinocladus_malaysianus.AAC.1
MVVLTSARTVCTEGTTKPWATPIRVRTATSGPVVENTVGVRRDSPDQQRNDRARTILPPN